MMNTVQFSAIYRGTDATIKEKAKTLREAKVSHYIFSSEDIKNNISDNFLVDGEDYENFFTESIRQKVDFYGILKVFEFDTKDFLAYLLCRKARSYFSNIKKTGKDLQGKPIQEL